MTRLSATAVLLLAGAGCVAGALRHASLRWGATVDEVDEVLAGDALIPEPDLAATRGVSIAAPAEAVWPWLVQLGVGRGGFYSYDRLERLVGLDVRSAETVEPGWQGLAVGDRVHLAPRVPLEVRVLESGHALVLQAVPASGALDAGTPYDFTWAFVLRPDGPGRTRLVVRERYACPSRRSRALAETVEWASLVMTHGMLRGVRRRAERR